MDNIKIIAYKKYQWDWLMSHNYSIDDLSDVASDWFNERLGDSNYNDSMSGYLYDQGINGSLWVCFEEFILTEYQDAAYMYHLLTKDEYEKYLKDVGRIKYSEKIEVETPLGKIFSTVISDKEYPGVALLYDISGQPGVIMEYDPEKKCIRVRVFGPEDPEGDPINVIRISVN